MKTKLFRAWCDTCGEKLDRVYFVRPARKHIQRSEYMICPRCERVFHVYLVELGQGLPLVKGLTRALS